MRKTRLALTTVALAAGAATVLTGCSTVQDALQKESSSRYEDVAALQDDGGPDAPWLPADAARIEVTRSTQAGDAVIRAESSEDLSAELCAEVERQSAPAYQPGETVDVFAISTAFACGEWTVVETDDGWLGWTPNDPDEKAQSPS